MFSKDEFKEGKYAKEHIFCRAFMGGFNREDVLRYIEELKLNESLLMRKFKEKEEEFSRTLLEKRFSSRTLAAKDRELSEANERISRLQSDIAIALKECESSRLKAIKRSYRSAAWKRDNRRKEILRPAYRALQAGGKSH